MLLEFCPLDALSHEHFAFQVGSQSAGHDFDDIGLRVGEVVQLKVSHLWFAGQPVSNLCVTDDIAKNHKQRGIPVSTYLNNAIRFLQEDFWKEYSEFEYECYRYAVDKIEQEKAMLTQRI